MTEELIPKIRDHNFKNKRVLIIGAGWMAEQYCLALKEMGINAVTVVSRSEVSANKCFEKYGYNSVSGGYNIALPKLGQFDLTIVATGINELKSASMAAAYYGNKNILVEKPACLYFKELEAWTREIENSELRMRVAYNRNVYPNVLKLKEFIQKEGGCTSCVYHFTEWIHTINFNNNDPAVYRRWGIANSLHVIALAHELIGFPQEISAYRSGELPWHPSGSRFSGSGKTTNGTLFAYQADWTSAGRWGVEITTPHNAYRLIPLEKLYRCSKGSVEWKELEVPAAYPNVKQGLAEQIAIMLNPALETSMPLVTLEKAAQHTKLAEIIFGYEKERIS